MNYFIFRNEQGYGPYTLETIQGFLRDGSVSASDLASREGSRERMALSVLLAQNAAPGGSVGASANPFLAPAMPSSNGAVPTLATVQTPVPSETAAPPALPEAGNAVTWPFVQPQWFASLWMIALWWVPLPIPLAQFLAGGWTLEAARRRATQDTVRLPQSAQVGKMLTGGLVIVAMYVLYYVIPVALIGWITAFGARQIVATTVHWLWDYILGHHAGESLAGFLWSQLLVVLLRAQWPLLYLTLVSPLFLVARVRFALRGEARVFFALPYNLYLLGKHLGDVLATMFFVFLTKFALNFLAILLASTGFGSPLSILLGMAQIWIVAYLYGSLGRQFLRFENQRRQKV